MLALALPRLRADAPASPGFVEQFRESIWAESVYAEFDLREMPRRGPEHLFHGRFWGSRNATGPVTRFEVDVGKGGFTRRLLVQGGAGGGVWTSDGPGPAVPADSQILTPIVAGTEVTPLDVLPMPYLYWLDREFVGSERVRGRPANVYRFTPPGDFRSRTPGVSSVKAYLDTQYDALVQSETVGADGHVAKTLSLLELRKAGDRWLPKDVDIRNEATRDKTRISLTGVAVGIAIDPSSLEPAGLASPLAPPAAGFVKRLSL
jgi:hypothetical protein